ncbi:MAG: tetratricopeptide repeat protein [Candidatus Latescibacteria bacterium]|nr:tetratricopeptide repeat protein [Candidatus Latescibacterota bacterium]
MSKFRWIYALPLALLLAGQVSTAGAEEAAQTDTAKAATKEDEEWLNTVWTQVDDMVKKEDLKLQQTVTVAGVRGAEAEDQVLDKLYYKGAKRYPSQDKLKKAIETLQQSIAKNPKAESVPQQRFYVAQCYEKLGQLKEAREAYAQVAKEHAKTAWATKAQSRLNELAAAK